MSSRLRGLLPRFLRRDRTEVPVVRLAGAIGMGSSPFRLDLTLAACAGPLARAFAIDAPAVALAINSPGGSPVQAHLIHRRIRALAEEKRRPVLAYVEDVAASGGYMLALAADEIIADPSSIVGSIGVISAGFGFDRLIERIGIDRRVYTAGDKKLMLDPFQPEQGDDVERLRALQAEVHAHFIALVKARRGDRLAADADLFSGRFWAGGRGRELGLVDALGDIRTDLRRRFGERTRLRLLPPDRGGLLRRRPPPGIDAAAGAVLAELEARALWARYGL